MTSTTLDLTLPRLAPLTPSLAPRKTLGRTLGRTLRELTAAAWRERSARLAVERATRSAIERNRPGTVVLDSIDQLADPGALLERLEGFRADETCGLVVVVRGRAAVLIEHADQLARLDRDHAVRLELACDGPTEAAPCPSAATEAAERLAARGLSVWLRLPIAAAGRRLRPLLDAAFAAGVTDVAFVDGAPTAAEERLRRLRLEVGFPRALPGRG